MIDEARMQAIRDARDKLRELMAVFNDIDRQLDEDVCLLDERLWWGEIEDDIHTVSTAMESVYQHINSTLGDIAEVTGEDEPVRRLGHFGHPRSVAYRRRAARTG